MPSAITSVHPAGRCAVGELGWNWRALHHRGARHRGNVGGRFWPGVSAPTRSASLTSPSQGDARPVGGDGSRGHKLFSSNAPLAMLLSLQAYERAQTPQARSALIEAAGQPLSDLLAEGSGTVLSVAFSPNGQHARGRRLRRRCRPMGHRHRPADRHLGRRQPRLTAVAFSPNGQTLAVGRRRRRRPVGHRQRPADRHLDRTAPVLSVAFNPNGQTLAAGDHDGHVGLWDTVSGRRTATLAEGSPVYAWRSARTARRSRSATQRRCRPVGHHHRRRTAILAEGGPVTSVAFSPNGQTLAAGD